MVCPRCWRETFGWPLARRDICAPPRWAHCIRRPEDIKKSLAPRKNARKVSPVRRDKSVEAPSESGAVLLLRAK